MNTNNRNEEQLVDCIDKVYQDNTGWITSIQTIKLIIKSHKFNSEQKVHALVIFGHLCQKKDNDFLSLTEMHILSRLVELVMGVKTESWMSVSEILFPYTDDKDKKPGLRFYLLLTEILRDLGI